MIDPAAAYFGAERAQSLLFICIGLIAIEIAVICWRKSGTRSAKGAAAALVLVAVIQLVVGATVFVRSPQDQARVTLAVAQHRPTLRSQEIPRMQQVMRNFVLYRWIEIGLLILAALSIWLARRGSYARGVGVGLGSQAALMLLLDGLAEQRGATYLAWLQSL